MKNGKTKKPDTVTLVLPKQEAEDVMKLLGKFNFYCVAAELTREREEFDEEDLERVWRSSNHTYAALAEALGKEGNYENRGA